MFGVKLNYSDFFYPLGFAVRLASNSPLALEAAAESWSSFRPQFHEPPLEFRVVVAESKSTARPTEVMYRAQGHLLTVIGDKDNSATFDLDRGFGFCVVSPSTISDRGYFRYYFLEGAVLTALEHRYLTAVHAACVALDERGVLLCGPSGCGKTCLSYACAKAGWTYITDDAVSLIRRRRDRNVIGTSDRIRFRPEASRLFPELGGLRQFISEGGKPSVEVMTADLPGIATAGGCRVEHVVFLSRRERGPVAVRPVSKEEALRRLVADLPISAPQVHEEQLACFNALLAAPASDLSYSDGPSAVSELQSLLRGVAV